MRSIDEPEIRINSIDYGVNASIKELDELLDYREDTSKFGLAKAALALSGFSPENASWPEGTRTLEEMLRLFGGGIELTTLAAIPGGSGLGTSSIMGAVLISVINRMLGKELTNRELFHCVLKLEQELTTGGGWQDQIGGTVDSVKVINTGPGMIPDPRIHYVPSDVLNPKSNDGQTLLYYTGLRRLAKNILRNEGYLKIQAKEIEQIIKLEREKIPENIEFKKISGLSAEVIEKLEKFNPKTIGEAKKIPGVTPAAIVNMHVYIKIKNKEKQG